MPQYKPVLYGTRPAKPVASVIIVAYKTGEELFACLDSLQQQTFDLFEVILVDNDICDQSRLTAYSLTYLQLDKNRGPSFARNQGAALARGNLLLFLDDDAIADPQWVEAAVTTLQQHTQLIAVRGRIIPKRDSYVNQMAGHYELGDSLHPAFIDLEGNCAIRRSAYQAVGGFNPKLFGSEGLDISYRLEQQTGDSIAYQPAMVLRHDFVDSFRHFVHKFYRHGRNEAALAVADAKVAAYKQQLLPHYRIPRQRSLFDRGILFALTLLGQAVSSVGKLSKHRV